MRFIYHFVIWLAIGALSGVYAARYSLLSPTTALLLSSLVAAIAIKAPRCLVLTGLFLGLAVGLWRADPKLDGYDLLARYQNQPVTLEATVIDDPIYHESGQFQLNANYLHLENRQIDATVRVRSFTNDVRRGDRIEVSGKLRDGFAYWQASLYYANINVLERDDSALAGFRSQFISNIYTTLPDPEASLGLGFLMGVRSLLPDELVDQLSITGLTHIVAVSGYNLTILASVSRQVFHRGSRFQAVMFTGLLITSFVMITGWSPSILRATIVSGLSISAWYYGRRFNPWLLLLYSSVLSALINPAYVWFDVGWYLSLSAFFGVLILAPMVQRRLVGDRKLSLLSQILFETSAAQIMTMPIIMLVFGEISMIALLANMLVLPLIPLAMLLTFIVGVAGFVSSFLVGLAFLPTYMLLRFITNIIRWLSDFEWALLELNMGVAQLVAVYAFVLFGLWLVRRSSPRSDII